MTKLFSSLFVIALTLLAICPQVNAANGTFTFQGRLTGQTGLPLNGDFDITFRIYYDSVSVTVYWEEMQTVHCDNGLFTMVLGAGATPLDPDLWRAEFYYAIQVGSDPEMLPRHKLNTDPLAYQVMTIDRATGGLIYGTVYASNYQQGMKGVIGEGGLYGGEFTALDGVSSACAVKADYINVEEIDATGVWGTCHTLPGYGYGGRFDGGWYGVAGISNAWDGVSAYHTGVYGEAVGAGTTGVHTGVVGSASGGLYNYGVKGFAYHNGTPGAYAYGVYGSAQYFDGYGAWAGFFNGYTTCNGTLQVIGTLIKPAGSFRIDHPLDPENKYLQHSFVESPDMKNIYDGNVVTDDKGDATVTMPDWFDALNRDFRYQLTVIGQFAQAIVSEKMHGNTFRIKTDKPNVEVSWQVTGIRQDAYANAHRIEVEVPKKAQEVGLYIDPVAFGKSPELQLYYKMNKAVEDERAANEQRAAKNRESK